MNKRIKIIYNNKMNNYNSSNKQFNNYNKLQMKKNKRLILIHNNNFNNNNNYSNKLRIRINYKSKISRIVN